MKVFYFLGTFDNHPYVVLADNEDEAWKKLDLFFDKKIIPATSEKWERVGQGDVYTPAMPEQIVYSNTNYPDGYICIECLDGVNDLRFAVTA